MMAYKFTLHEILCYFMTYLLGDNDDVLKEQIAGPSTNYWNNHSPYKYIIRNKKT